MEEGNKEPKKPMTHEERIQLATKLDGELDEFINGLEKKRYEEGWPEDKWEEEMDKHPFFMKKAPEPGEEIHPLLEGIQQLKYDPEENTAEELGVSYKDDGNFNFKHKNYRLAILSYTEGIKQKFVNAELRASLHNNRSASHFFLKNYRSSLADAERALKLNPSHEKCSIRAANCCFAISQFDKCVEFCDNILLKQSENKEILELRQKAINIKKNAERNARKKQLAEKKKKAEEEAIIKEIFNRGIKLDVNKDTLKLENLEPKFPELAQSRVCFDVNNQLIWPIVLLYPEYKLTEFIQSFCENDKIEDLLNTVFEEHANWDLDRKYIPSNLNVYFENRYKTKVHKVSSNKTVKEILNHKEYIVMGGTPTFIILAKDSAAEKHFLKNYT